MKCWLVCLGLVAVLGVAFYSDDVVSAGEEFAHSAFDDSEILRGREHTRTRTRRDGTTVERYRGWTVTDDGSCAGATFERYRGRSSSCDAADAYASCDTAAEAESCDGPARSHRGRHWRRIW